ncbi:mechanosensitive ion channel [Marinicella sp. S1101]|uniref:mechanosensitive ion channel domain-containing protein n=1 Tax=Marinicella marina TaxID=2996016 RepID=UPI002260D72F|nr:mechanosensitive ion channel domain-containing protein [Marinicella marina]MCX7552436.1 mechanosensitive ion channel [Marinicella marina]MDJ1139311.1 mechanosensitive ion channel [Marinicella marina]
MSHTKNLICIVLLLLSCSGSVRSQDETEKAAEPSTWTDTQQQIEVSQKVSDEAIKDRFSNILKVSERIKEAKVTVTEGVLVLEGWTQDSDNKAWVDAAANRTEGVIAVVNNIEVRMPEQWDLDPAVNEAVNLYEKFIRSLPKLSIALIVLLLTWLVAKVIVSMATRLLANKIHNPFVLRMGSRLFAVPVVVVGIYMVLQLTGLTNLAVTVIGGTGLLGLVIGIAFKDIAENFLASVLISVQRPFKIGDYIVVDGHQGVVQSVTTRGTVIMTLEGNHIHIPNAIIYKNTIVNVTANPNIRKTFVVGIGYGDNISNAQAIAGKVLQNHLAVLDQPEPQVLVDTLGAATVNLKVYFWVNGEKHSATKVKSAVIRLIKKAFDEAEISMPDEAREVVFPEGINITHAQQQSSEKQHAKTSVEPEHNATEADLSNDVDDIRKQSAENQLSDSDNNLIKDE